MKNSELVVTVFSFSYMKGIPADKSGNGGGFVFDCRAIHNPGRYEQYKNVSGLDDSVISFLEGDGEILNFLKSTSAILDFHVARFMERGFSHLFVAFGCTGGQHRSVYAAQKTAEYLNRKFGIEVHLTHREQEITKIFGKKNPAPLSAIKQAPIACGSFNARESRLYLLRRWVQFPQPYPKAQAKPEITSKTLRQVAAIAVGLGFYSQGKQA